MISSTSFSLITKNYDNLSTLLSISTSTNCSEQEEIARLLQLYTYPFLLTIGTIGNLLSLIVLLQMRSHSVYRYLTFMSIADTALLYTGLLRDLLLSSNLHIHIQGNLLCKIHVFFFYNTFHLSSWFRCCLNLDRYVAVKFPIYTSKWCRTKQACINTCIIIVLFSILNFHLILFVHGDTNSSNISSLTTVNPFQYQKCYLYDHYQQFFLTIYSWIDMFVVTIIPFLFIILCNLTVINRVFIVRQISSIKSKQTHHHVTRSKATKRLRSLCLIMICSSIVFVATTLPVTAFIIDLNTHNVTEDKLRCRKVQWTIYNILMYFNYASILTYCLSGTEFRHVFIQTLTCFNYQSALASLLSKDIQKQNKKNSRQRHSQQQQQNKYMITSSNYQTRQQTPSSHWGHFFLPFRLAYNRNHLNDRRKSSLSMCPSHAIDHEPSIINHNNNSPPKNQINIRKTYLQINPTYHHHHNKPWYHPKAMHIKEIVLEGFKSYASRTTVGPFDEYFNAVTGLNGSGKSNILDSICFVMGITSLHHVRASGLTDLIYKQGTAGITRASVSIVFDNRNPDQSPDGYKSHQELTVTRIIETGGKSKYLLNGKIITQTAIHDLFKSVSLNVNNPRFLILQGQVTKVSRSKPAEILGLVEEAAGTKMYDQKKADALKTIEKKNAKLNEIRQAIEDDITPTINKLQQDEKNYKDYQEIKKKYKLLQQQSAAYDYYQLSTIEKESANEKKQIENSLTECNDRIQTIGDKIKQIGKDVKHIEQSRNESVGNAVSEMQKDYEKHQSELRSLQNENLIIEKRIKTLKQQVEQNENDHRQGLVTIEDVEKTIKDKEVELDNLNKKLKLDMDHVVQLQQRHYAVTTGTNTISDSKTSATSASGTVVDDSKLTNREKLTKYKEQKAQLVTSIKQLQQRCEHTEKELKKLRIEQQQVQKKQGSYSTMKTQYDQKKKGLEQIDGDLKQLNFDLNNMKQLQTDYRLAEQLLDQKRHKLQQLKRQNQHLDFVYIDPEQNFDRKRRVHGLVASLFTIKDKKYSQALEVAGGSKLFNVVVDTDMTGTLLLKKGNLTRRIVFAPLNRIQGDAISKQKIDMAKREFGNDNVHLAKDLINYDKKYEQLINYVFGRYVICADTTIAGRVAFDEKLGLNAFSVTYDGDTYNPAGILSGGSNDKQSKQNLLDVVNELNIVEQECEQQIQKNMQLKSELQKLEMNYGKYQDFTQKLNSLTQELNLLEINLQQNDEHRLQTDIQHLEQDYDKFKGELVEYQEQEKQLTIKINDLEKAFKNEHEAKAKELKDVEQLLQKAEKQIDLTNKQIREKEYEIKDLQMQLEEHRKDNAQLQEDLNQLQQQIQQNEKSFIESKESITEKKHDVDEILSELTKKREKLTDFNNQIHLLNQEEQELIKERRQREILMEEYRHKLTDIKKAVHDSTKKCQLLLEEEKNFNQPNTLYDFQHLDIPRMKKQLNDLKERLTNLSKNVDERSMTLLEQKRTMYKQLLTKQKKVLKDKANIEKVVQDWDKKKQDALRIAWEKVNKSFGEIFSTLLHDSNAKLTSHNGHYDYENAPKDLVLSGLEIKVKLGPLWKDTLDELSGGQRSLAGLSLVLALLTYNPAPLYILDEVDAALDMSHTQNIGLVIKKNFRNAQFIIVSLKDGMFSNANVLFTTKFMNGISNVVRAENKKKD
ncbi:unnamed protein product [Didymodactylos carnosus]|uniref:G-protein coupled receptors family 1 profile domain-containing protein n=5 Tax=Didymodactylos carnosus TaxID=1234261 RepID=A0A814P6X7_9BILA|nr:unnamed protein product [Didymodactylos carnosus]CAF3868430.1 unnamed protein product [Didymodactylos carnosus]